MKNKINIDINSADRIKQKKESVRQKTSHLKLFGQRRTKQKEQKRVQRALINYGIPLRGTFYILSDSQRREKGAEIFLNNG